jgi:molybdopterin/thiamine biosynthesis adenylyltransferase
MTIGLDVFDRQRRISGWRQERFQKARVAVVGRGWLGTFLVWELNSLGVGQISWIGQPRPETEGLARFLLRRTVPGNGGTILDDPFDVEYGPELAWAMGGISPDILVCTTERRDELMLALDWADRNRVRALAGRASGGGWFGTDPRPGATNLWQDPAIALVVASLLADAVRERLNPLTGGVFPPERGLGLTDCGASSQRHCILMVGVGGIGVWAATAICAALGDRVHLHFADFDRVAPENLNRQVLFTKADALAQVPKAEAAQRSLAQIFPQVKIISEVGRIGPDDAVRLGALDPRPTVILSAVDNAASRLALQQLGRDLGVPVIQAGTAVFAADCFTQTVGGPSLDDQMHGSLGAAAARESQENRAGGGCTVDPSYVVPSAMAGAFLAYRLVRMEHESSAAPLRWRSGDHPGESRTNSHDSDLAELLGRFALLHTRWGAAEQADLEDTIF